MKLEDIRKAIVEHVHTSYVAAFPAIPIVHDNQAFDWNDPPAQFVELEVEFQDAAQIGMSAIPTTRDSGFVYVTAYARAGKGVNASLRLLDWFRDRLGYATPGGVQLGAPAAAGPGKPAGWHTQGLKVPFYA